MHIECANDQRDMKVYWYLRFARKYVLSNVEYRCHEQQLKHASTMRIWYLCIIYLCVSWRFVPYYPLMPSVIATCGMCNHDDVIKWKHFSRNWPFVRGIHRSPVNSPHKGQWRGALMYFLICVWINDWVNNREAGDLRPNRAHYDVTVMNFLERHVVESRNTNSEQPLNII